MLAETIKKKIFFYLILAISIGIVLQTALYKAAIIALFIQWLLRTDNYQKALKIKQNILALGLICFFCFYAISFFWSENETVAITDTILKLPLIILPLIIFSQKSLTSKQLNTVFIFFSVGSVIINLTCLLDAYFSFVETNQKNEFYYSKLPVNMHPAYQSMFTCFSIVLFVYLFFKEKFISNWITYVLVAIQVAFVLLLSSRMQILIMMVVIPFYLILFHYYKKKTLLGLCYTLLIFVLGYFIIKTPSTLNNRYNTTVSQISSIGIDNDNSDPRKFIWIEGLELIKKSWALGMGNGDAKALLVARFSKSIKNDFEIQNLLDSTVFEIQKNKQVINMLKDKNFDNNLTHLEQLRNYAKFLLDRKNNHYKVAHRNEYNFHSQYLQTLAEIGIFGFLLLCIILAYPFVIAIKNRDYLTISFLFIVGSSFLTESMLERQAGVVFFAFFYALLIGRLTRIDSLNSSVES